jgi:hypothetical protein
MPERLEVGLEHDADLTANAAGAGHCDNSPARVTAGHGRHRNWSTADRRIVVVRMLDNVATTARRRPARPRDCSSPR